MGAKAVAFVEGFMVHAAGDKAVVESLAAIGVCCFEGPSFQSSDCFFKLRLADEQVPPVRFAGVGGCFGEGGVGG